MKLDKLKHLRVAVWGYGLEGKATAAYLSLRCPSLDFTVLCKSDEIDKQPWSFFTEEIDAKQLSQYDVVIKSPGISPYQYCVENASCQIISSSALWFDNERNGTVIAVTGTKGKSTTSAMLNHVLLEMGFKSVLAGNFGLPLISCLDDYDFVVLETSSYQSQDGSIAAEIAVLLNLYSEHLNWHQNEQQYHLDKWCLINQSSQVVLNAKDSNSLKLFKKQPPQSSCHWFNETHGFYVLQDVLMYQDKALMSKHGWALKGEHNLINAAAVCTVTQLLKLDIKPCINAIKSFQPLPHRLQTVLTLDGVTYINDSISSTPHATLAALNTLERHKTIVLVGGFDRGVDWSWWVESIKEAPPKMIICSGENGEKIHQLILNQKIKTQSMYYEQLSRAVQVAKQHAQSGQVVLLSPGAPSFDAFENYQHRGEQFKQWIK